MICDHQLLFTDVYAGEVGSLHDYTVFRRSPVFQSMQEGEVTIIDDCHLVGDLAYKLAVNLLVGFKDNGHLTQRQKNFNFVLSKVRVRVEN